MVLVGHSMGGLISMLQTIDSGDRFWGIVSDRPIGELKGDPETKAALQEMFYFKANPSIKKLITLATPFKGSDFANRTTQWISQRSDHAADVCSPATSESWQCKIATF